jgi:hypothetical protein
MDIETCTNQFKQLLTNYCPSGNVPEHLLRIINNDIKKFVFQCKKKRDTKLLCHPYYGYKCNVDKEIAKLIEYLWYLRINIDNFSENNIMEGYVWINFCTQKDLEKFLNILFTGSKMNDNNYERACNLLYYQKGTWMYDYCIRHDHSLEDDYCIDDEYSKKNNIVKYVSSSISLIFPKSDYIWILDKIVQYLENQKKIHVQISKKIINDYSECIQF